MVGGFASTQHVQNTGIAIPSQMNRRKDARVGKEGTLESVSHHQSSWFPGMHRRDHYQAFIMPCARAHARVRKGRRERTESLECRITEALNCLMNDEETETESACKKCKRRKTRSYI